MEISFIKFYRIILFLPMLWWLSCKTSTTGTPPIQIAFMADVHLLDVYGDLEGAGYKGVKTLDGRPAILRTMNAQLHSTRLFNENYFAFIAALDGVVERGIKYVALPGDFSDDGQLINLKGLQRILDYYSEVHNISFFAITGNHDPTRPFGKEGGKPDFLGKNGKSQAILSNTRLDNTKTVTSNPSLISPDMREAGYKEIAEILKDYGFSPKPEYLFWATPFSEYTYDEYVLGKASHAAEIDNRTYTISSSDRPVPDVSYVVEPAEGLWLLAIDANVHLPKANGREFEGAGIGYNRVLEHKSYLLDWIKLVIEESKKHNKTLIAFSHYPMVDFNDGASRELRELFGQGAFQTHRIPDETVAELFANIGLKIHIGGHMHLNDTGVHRTGKNKTLINVQTPSLAAYPPAYKILTVKENNVIGVETVVLDSVKGFDTFFDVYKKEHAHLRREGLKAWNTDILNTTDYLEYTREHLKNLVRMRLSKEWPKYIKKTMDSLNGFQLLTLACTDDGFSKDALNTVLNGDETDSKWQKAKSISKAKILKNGFAVNDFEAWTGSEWILDFYRIRNADKLAMENSTKERIEHYHLITSALSNKKGRLLKDINLFATIFKKQLSGEPSVNFEIDVIKSMVTPTE